ncbi:MAG: alpha/beta hydrolase [Lysobacterales bacterium]|jgi:pimeloyl-ACP methyl ester carboxylesterase|nr:MAG: alpha/beta hydrolase [Xanthomonadales bacterium]
MVTTPPVATRVFAGSGGLPLAADCYGSPKPPAVLFAHGFGQTRHSWKTTALSAARAGFFAVAADGRGHGDSGRNPSHRPYQVTDFVADLRALAQMLPGRPALVGASMGGLLGLLAEGSSPEGLFSALVLVDIAPRWEEQGVARILAFMAAHPEGFASLTEAQQAIARYLPHRQADRDPERLRPLLREHADGRWRWHWDPRLLSELPRDQAAYRPWLCEAARRIRIPTLLVSGGRSDVLSADGIADFRALVPHAEHVQIPEATHLVAGDANDAFAEAVLDFLSRVARRRAA